MKSSKSFSLIAFVLILFWSPCHLFQTSFSFQTQYLKDKTYLSLKKSSFKFKFPHKLRDSPKGKDPMESQPSSSSFPIKISPQTTTLISSSINLLKNCLGSAIFSVPYRVNSITQGNPFQSNVLIPSLLCLIVSWAIYSFNLLGEICGYTNSSTYTEAWRKSVSQYPSLVHSEWIVQSVLILAPLIGCLANILVLIEVLKVIFSSVFSLPISLVNNRFLVVSILCSMILYPLCIIPSLSGLKSVSLIGISGQLIVTICFMIRIMDGSYRVNGKYFDSSKIGSLAKDYLIQGSQSLIKSEPKLNISRWFLLVSMLSYCFVAHFNVSYSIPEQSS